MNATETSGSERKAILRAKVKNYLPAVACALTPILCYVAIRPFAEIAIVDDWSFVKTAQLLAQTGHMIYNGWSIPILGWQAYLGALFIKLFGFSFTAVRLSTVVESMATAFLLHRTFVRAGVNSWNATLATMTFVLSPLYFPLQFTFMTDVSGVLCIVVCLYMCLRALEAASERSAMVWISLAALVNALGGTARQIAWLGVLVMVPSTLWMLRKNRRVFVSGCLSVIAALFIAAFARYWFARQPYTIPEPLIPSGIDLSSVRAAVAFGLRSAGQLALLALPVLLMFAGTLRRWNRRGAAVLLVGLCCLVVPGIALTVASKMHLRFELFVDDSMIISAFEKLNTIAARGIQFSIAIFGLPVLLLGALILGTCSLVVWLFKSAGRNPVPQQPAIPISWKMLGVVLVPYCLAYIVILVLFMLTSGYFSDRFLVPLFAILLLALTRYYQQTVKANLPLACVLLIAVFGGFSLLATHDMFAQYRGYASAIGQIQSTGVPATAILGPWEFEAWTEIEKVGYVDDHRIRIPKGAYAPPPARSFPTDCDPVSVDFLDWTPAVNPAYAIVPDPTQCGGQLALLPITYATWIAPHTNSIYVARLPAASSQ
jgi:hypothetical protein